MQSVDILRSSYRPGRGWLSGSCESKITLTLEGVPLTDAYEPLKPATLTVVQALQQAIAHHQAGQAQEAERLYRAILQARPNHTDANHNLGVLAVKMKQPAAGLPHLKAALETSPNQGQYWLSYIDALILAGHIDIARQVLERGRQRGLQGEAVDALAGRLEPSPQEINKLTALFNEGRYSEVVTLAQALTVRFPQHAAGWKVLGAVLKQLGRGTDALAPMQKATALSPGDAEAHSNLGATLKGVGRLVEAEASYQRALQIKPDYAEAYNNLGNTLKELGRLDEAEASLRRALQINPDFAGAHSNLGNTLNDLGRLDEAEASLRRALQIKPDYAEVHNNLGITLKELGRLDEAEASFRHALRGKPDYAKAHNNLGNTLQALGRLGEAEASYRQALQIKSDYVEAYYNLGNTLCNLDNLDQAAVVYQKILEIDPDNIGLNAAVYLATLCYLEGNLEQCRSMLLVSQPILAMTGIKHKNSCIYWRYLDKLLSWHWQSRQKDNKTQGMERLYVIGESHSLTPHGMVVRHREQEMHCAAEWIEGCKQWHLGNGKANKYKHKFAAVMARLPRNSTILLCIGEIDCRRDEGILKAWRKYPGKALAEMVQSTVEAYLIYVAATASRYGHRIIAGGVPAPHILSDALTANADEQLVQLIRILNATLKNLALTAGMDFLDVYALTDRGDGVASGEWHIDKRHLLPSAIVEAFGKHCLHQQQ